MASVRMTKDLRSGILSKFREALVATIQNNPELTNLGDKMYSLVHSPLELEWLDLSYKLWDSFDGSQQKRSNEFKQNVSMSDKLVLLLCPKDKENFISGDKPKEYVNFQIIGDWSSKENKYSGSRKFYEGELAIELPLGISKPQLINQNYFYHSYDNEISVVNPFVITDLEIINLLKQFLEGDIKANASVDKLDILPKAFMDKMFDKRVSNSNQRAVLANNTLEKDFKDEMNAAILTAKLTT